LGNDDDDTDDKDVAGTAYLNGTTTEAETIWNRPPTLHANLQALATMIVAAVPVKDLENAKQRLVRLLTPGERSELARAMLGDVLRALKAARLDRVWVVTRELAVAMVAHPLGAQPLAEEDNRGHTAAVARAQAEAMQLGATLFMTVPGDVPCVTADEIRALADAAVATRAAVFAPSRSGLGTNGVALKPPDAMRLRFGEPSFENHLAAARALGLAPRTVKLPGLALDIDAPDDVAALLERPAETETQRLLSGWRLPERLAAAGAVRSD
jgi:2-phospho-L-lactate guanylyltransferase